jgi:hypothetical protein
MPGRTRPPKHRESVVCTRKFVKRLFAYLAVRVTSGHVGTKTGEDMAGASPCPTVESPEATKAPAQRTNTCGSPVPGAIAAGLGAGKPALQANAC